jgi:hypothetical protein
VAAGEGGEVTRGSVRVQHGCILDTDKKKVYGRDAGSPAARRWRKIKKFVYRRSNRVGVWPVAHDIRSDSTTLPIVLPRQPCTLSDQI